MAFEEGTNFARILGRKTYPRETARPRGIGEQAIALIGGETPIHLAQRFRVRETESQLPRFRQVPGGGSQLPAFNAPGLESVLPQVVARPISRLRITSKRLLGQTVQVTRSITSNFPMLQKLKGRLRGQGLGYIGPGWDAKNVPTPYSPRMWRPGANVAELPAVTGIISGPEKTVHPQMHLSVEL
jgi:hypothetical protein